MNWVPWLKGYALEPEIQGLPATIRASARAQPIIADIRNRDKTQAGVTTFSTRFHFLHLAAQPWCAAEVTRSRHPKHLTGMLVGTANLPGIGAWLI